MTHYSHRITLSARASTLGGIVRPICLAAFNLITNSNLVGCSTGNSAGFIPFAILSTYVAARRYNSESFGPYADMQPLSIQPAFEHMLGIPCFMAKSISRERLYFDA